MSRVHQFVLIASTLAFSWLGMMIVHEFGHIAGAWLTGGTIAKPVPHPLAFSRTDLSHNPHPLGGTHDGLRRRPHSIRPAQPE